MNTVLKVILIFVASIVLAYVLAPVGGALHKLFWGAGSCSLFVMVPCNSDRAIEGFTYLYILLLSLGSFALLAKKAAWWTFGLGSGLLWGLIIWATLDSMEYERAEYIGTLVIMLVSFAAGYLIVFGIKKLTHKT